MDVNIKSLIIKALIVDIVFIALFIYVGHIKGYKESAKVFIPIIAFVTIGTTILCILH